MGERRGRRRRIWIYVVAATAGVVFFALAVWLAFHDGIPTWKKGEQPVEVFVLTGLGFFTFLFGATGIQRAYKERQSGGSRSSD